MRGMATGMGQEGVGREDEEEEDEEDEDGEGDGVMAKAASWTGRAINIPPA